MRSYNLSLLCLVTLASCASKPVELSANRCWAVSVSDKVEGTAVLFAHAANDDGCIECGASVSGQDCPGVGFAWSNVGVKQAYNRIVQSASQNELGNVQVVVRLAGEIVPEGGAGEPLLLASRLSLVEANPPGGL